MTQQPAADIQCKQSAVWSWHIGTCRNSTQ